MHMLQSLMFIEATLGSAITTTYISTTANHLANNLSCNNLASFLLKVPTADVELTTPTSPDLLELLPDRLELSDLAPSVHHYFQSSLAVSTHATYKAGLSKFYEFSVRYNISSPFLVSEQTLYYSTAFMANQGLSPQTERSYLLAACSMQISQGLPDPTEQSAMRIFARVQAGIRRTRALQPRVRLPITVIILQRVKRYLGSREHRHRLALWAISDSAFFGFFRLGVCVCRVLELPIKQLTQPPRESRLCREADPTFVENLKQVIPLPSVQHPWPFCAKMWNLLLNSMLST